MISNESFIALDCVMQIVFLIMVGIFLYLFYLDNFFIELIVLEVLFLEEILILKFKVLISFFFLISSQCY